MTNMFRLLFETFTKPAQCFWIKQIYNTIQLLNYFPQCIYKKLCAQIYGRGGIMGLEWGVQMGLTSHISPITHSVCPSVRNIRG